MYTIRLDEEEFHKLDEKIKTEDEALKSDHGRYSVCPNVNMLSQLRISFLRKRLYLRMSSRFVDYICPMSIYPDWILQNDGTCWFVGGITNIRCWFCSRNENYTGPCDAKQSFKWFTPQEKHHIVGFIYNVNIQFTIGTRMLYLLAQKRRGSDKQTFNIKATVARNIIWNC